MPEETLQFQAEVSRLLDLMVHSVYSNKEIFLRELISNASDACDKLRYEALTRPELLGDSGGEFRIAVAIDKAARRISVSDNGIGMSRDELVQNLGTIARSGTAAFIDRVAGEKQGDQKADVAQIGQFGVGFYSVFMVADHVEVVSRRAGEDAAWAWKSDGKGSFSVDEGSREGRGTTVTLHLRAGEDEWLEEARLRHIIKTYSDHIAVPIALSAGEKAESETVNAASALWTRAKSEITPEQYKEFYHHVAHAFDEPWLTLHWRAEGKIDYAALLFVPERRPFDLFHPERRPGIKLYAKRVFITEDCAELVPAYLRFLRGVVDSDDLPLNISREMLQRNPVLTQIRAGVTRRVLQELERKAEKEPEAYATFWETFGAVLKEGIYEDRDQRDALLKLSRFRSTSGEGWVSLADYIGRLRPGQDAIYYITGDQAQALRASPQIEGFAARGIEVLLLDDPVDEFWLGGVGEWEGKPFRSVTRGDADLSKVEPAEKKDETPEDAADLGPLLALLRLTLADAVKDVRGSDRLTDSPVCLVADSQDMDMHLERLLKQHRQVDTASRRILELNPKHALIRGLAARLSGEGGHDLVKEMAWVLLDQARIVEGEPLPDPAGFSKRLAALLGRNL